MAEAVPTTTDQATIAAATTGVEAPKEYAVSFADGKVYKDSDPTKLLTETEKRYNNLYPEFEKLKQENAAFRDQAAKMAGVSAPTNGFDANKYYQIWATDPLKADEYKREFDPAWQQGLKAVKQSEWDRNVSVFIDKHPEFKPSPENIEGLSKMMNQLYPYKDVVLNPDQIEAAHLKAVQEKYYSVDTVGGTVPDKKDLPPTPPAGASSQGIAEVDINKMSQPELRAYIEKEAAKLQK